MAMERRFTVVLDQAEIEKACVAYLSARIAEDEQATARLGQETTGGAIVVTVTVSKKRIRKAKP